MADQVLQDIKDKLDIIDVIGGYIQTKRSGTNFKAVCPFHNEKSASLMISPQKQIWHCFGCGEGGDIFGFVMRYEGIEFREALNILAAKAGVTLPAYNSQSQTGGDETRKLIIRINTFAAKVYHAFLMNETLGKQPRDYLANRGLKQETIESWGIGFAPNDFHALEQELVKKSVKSDQAILAGVSVKNDQGQIYDRFRNRITFPIKNYFGDVVGFSARTLEQNTEAAKYVNSPETAAYNKSKILFGLFEAKEHIRKQGAVVIVEGQMDCISAQQAGFGNTIATSGTAMTFEHVMLLKRLSDTIIFCFDADSAGQAASKRAGSIAIPMGLNVKVITLPSGKDPDELIQSDPKAWEKAVNDAVWFIDHYIDQAGRQFAFNSIEQKQHISTEIVPLIRLCPDPIQQDHYFRQVSQAFSISEQALRSTATTQKNYDSNAESLNTPISHQEASDPVLVLEKQILGGLLSVNEFLNSVREEIDLEDFVSPEIRDLVAHLKNGDTSEEQFDSPLAKEAQFMVESQLEYLDNNTTALVNELHKSFYLLKLRAIKQRQQDVTVALKQAEALGQAQEVQALKEQFSLLSSMRMQYESHL
jgi:DNA primase